MGLNVGAEMDGQSKKINGKRRMPHFKKQLKAAFVRSAPPRRHTDGGGLYLYVSASGARRGDKINPAGGGWFDQDHAGAREGQVRPPSRTPGRGHRLANFANPGTQRKAVISQDDRCATLVPKF